jgi:hypothetical protein
VYAQSTRKQVARKLILRLPDLDHAKTSLLNSLSSPRSRRNYKFATEQSITWYCSEPRLALDRTVVLRFRLHLESLRLAAGTINQRLAAVRRLAFEAADAGLLSPELAAGIITGHSRASLQSSEPSRNALGNRHLRERRLVCGPELCPASGNRPPRTT